MKRIRTTEFYLQSTKTQLPAKLNAEGLNLDKQFPNVDNLIADQALKKKY